MVLRLKNRVPLLTHTDAFFCLLASLADLLQSLPGACGLSSQKIDKKPSMLNIRSTSDFGSHSCDVGISFPRIYSRASLVPRHFCDEQRIVSSLREGSGAWASGAFLGQ